MIGFICTWANQVHLKKGCLKKAHGLQGNGGKPMKALGEPEEGNSMYPLGLHGDGVPVKGRKNQSTLDYWTINFVGSRKNGRARFLIGCGQRACRRHDGKKLDMAKAWRRQLSSS